MIKNLYYLILKKIYKFFIVNIIIIQKEKIDINSIKIFASVDIRTTHGNITFNFAQDRRNTRKKFLLKNFIVSIKVPEASNELLKQLEGYLILIIKIGIIKINYKALSELLFELCLDRYIEIAEHVRMENCKECKKYQICQGKKCLICDKKFL